MKLCDFHNDKMQCPACGTVASTEDTLSVCRYGPGTALKSLLASIGITADGNCPCTARAREMDTRGCDWCEQNIDTIVGWLREQAEARSLPFLDAAGRLLVRRAIRNARRAAAN